MPAGKLTGSVRWAGAPMATGRCLAGARPGAVRCTELCVLWHPYLLYLKLRCTFWDAAVWVPHGQYSFQMATGRQTPIVVHISWALEGPWGSRRVHVRNPWAPQGARKDFSWELTPKHREGPSAPSGAHTGPVRCPTGPLRAFYGLTVR